MQKFREKQKNEQYNKIKLKEYESFEETIKYMDQEDYQLFLNNVRHTQDKNRQRNRLIFEMLLSTGMRVEEFSLMKVSDISFKESMITIPKENSKTSRSRVVRCREDLLLDLKDYLINQNIKSGYVFRNPRTNKPLTTRALQKLCNKYYDARMAIKPSPHTFRHTHAVFALQNGVPINAVMQNLGHSSITTTQIYARLAGIDISKGYEKWSY